MIHKVRKTKITKNEIIADLIFLLFGAIISFLALFIFDIHWSLYERPIFPLKHIFQTPDPYLLGVPAGMLVIFFLIKIFIFALREEESG